MKVPVSRMCCDMTNVDVRKKANFELWGWRTKRSKAGGVLRICLSAGQ